MHTTTPPRISRRIQQLTASIVPDGKPVYLTVHPETGAVANECFPNVEAKIAIAGGRMQCGWQIWEWPQVMVEAEFHAVWVSPEGQMVEITPKAQGENTILFLPDPRRTYSGISLGNVRMPLRDDLLVLHFIKASDAITHVLNRGERAFQHGLVSIPADEIEPLKVAQGFLGQSILAGLRDHDPCRCRSGKKYKRCHGRSFESEFGL